MKMKIYKKGNDVFSMFNEEEVKLDFEFLKKISKDAIVGFSQGKEWIFEIESESGLELYEDTIQNLIESIRKDSELIELYKESIAVEKNNEEVK